MMKKKTFTYALYSLLLTGLLSFIVRHHHTPSQKAKTYFETQADYLQKKINELGEFLSSQDKKNDFDTIGFRSHLTECRNAYKMGELYIEYYFPEIAEEINGPLVNEADETGHSFEPIPPHGLQVLMDWTYLGNGTREEIKLEVEILKKNAGQLAIQTASLEVKDEDILQAVKEEYIRIFILSLSGYDSPDTRNTIAESALAISSIDHLIKLYKTDYKNLKDIIVKLQDLHKTTIQYLGNHTDFNELNRIYLIKEIMNPCFIYTEELRSNLNLSPPSRTNALLYNATGIWDPQSFQTEQYAEYPEKKVNTKMIELGRLLFFDPILSGTQQRSCASCHQPQKGFTDGLTTSLHINGKDRVNRNAPTLLNAALQSLFFYDSRAGSLEEQVKQVVENKEEMNGHLEDIVAILRQSTTYKNLFIEAFKGSDETLITPMGIMQSIAAFERTLISFNSRFDQYMRNEKNVTLTPSEINGFNVFMGKALCGTCHFPPAFNGLVPPGFSQTESEVLGIPEMAHAPYTLDKDLGRFMINRQPVSMHAFKTPTIRNVEYTAPYMHNGAYATLLEVIEFYDDGGGNGLGMSVPNQTLPADELHLTDAEIQDLMAFLKSLSDTTHLHMNPPTLPAIEGNPPMNSRLPGGNY